MNKESDPIQNLNTPERIRQRNRKAALLTMALLLVVSSTVLLIRNYVTSRSNTFGSVNGVSTETGASLTKISFVDSGNSPTAKVFGDLNTPFTPEAADKFWLKFNIGEKTEVGYLDNEMKFNKVYDLPASVVLVDLLSDGSILFTDEPAKETPALYYQSPGAGTVRFATLDFQDTFISIYFDPSEKLIYYIGKDNSNTFFLNSVNEKGKESSIYKTGDLTANVQISYVDSEYSYLKDGQNCYQLSFLRKVMNVIDCSNVKRNDLGKVYTVLPAMAPVYSDSKPGEFFEINSIDGSKRSLLALSEGQTISKFSYRLGKVTLARSSLNPIADATYVPKDVGVMSLNLEDNQLTEVTTKLPSEVVSNYYNFSDKYLAVGGSLNSRLLVFVPNGSTGQIYVGDISPVSYASVTKYWLDVDLGGSVSNIKVIGSDFAL